jgi:hypothetical protein
MYITTTGTVVAQLTRLGRQLLADNSANFRITQYKFSDDGIDYSLFDGSAVDAPNTNILNTPVLEANTVGGVPSQRYSLFTEATNFTQVSWIDVDADKPFVDGQQEQRSRRNRAGIAVNTDRYTSSNPFQFKVRTFYGNDSFYLVSHSDLLETQFSPILTESRDEVVTFSRPAQVSLPNHKPQGVPCTDPFEVDQNQSEASILFYPIINNSSFIIANLNFDRLNFLNQQGEVAQAAVDARVTGFASGSTFIQAWMQYYVERIQTGIAKAMEAVDLLQQGKRPPASQFNSLQFIDQYGETGLATGQLTIRGTDTGELFTVEALLYSPTILRHIFGTLSSK